MIEQYCSAISFLLSSCPVVKTKLILFARLVTTVVDLGPPADWVKINVRETVSSSKIPSISTLCLLALPLTVMFLHKQKDCFEIYALVPGLLREEVCTSRTACSVAMFYCTQMPPPPEPPTRPPPPGKSGSVQMSSL